MKKRNRPDKDGSDKSKVMRFKRLAEMEQANCYICGLPIDYSLKYPNPWSFTVDHVVPIDRGGTSNADNLRAAHFRCNRIKGVRLTIPISEINKLRLEQGCTEMFTERKKETSGTNYMQKWKSSVVEEKNGLIPNNILPLSRDWTQYRSDE